MQNNNYFIKNKKKKLELNVERRKLQVIIKGDKLIKNKIFILELLYSGILDRYMIFLSDDKIIINHSSFIKKGYVTCREHFIYVLDNFITYFSSNFSDIYLILNVLSFCVNSSYGDVLLSKHYLYDNDNLDYYSYRYNLMIIDGFYNNFLNFKDELSKEIESIGFVFDLDNKLNVEKNMMILEEICFINKGHYGLLSLFDKVNNNNFDMYLMYWNMLLNNYFDNMEFVKYYREFKKNNDI